jgi:5,5'-dehydrodivanillate O-demethylase oxygenase subunit
VPDYGETHDFIRFEYGILKRRTTPGKKPGDPPQVDEHPLIFPSILRHVAKYKGGFRHNLQIRVPVDDTHTRVFRVSFVPSATDRSPVDDDPPFEYSELKGPDGRFDMTMVPAQDAMAWETQGGLADRSLENLGTGDRGVILLRKLLKEQIDIVKNGGEPMGIIRDPQKNEMIQFDVINERIGLFRSTDKKVA